jgi:peptidoglycan/xylan/chitin deacetylase (PgdA/CDA1 family)
VGPDDKVVALTFDDGPDRSFTPRVLDVLSHYQVPATFFMIGWEAAASPDLVKRVAAAGNGVGSHTWNHVDLTRQSDAGLAIQVDKTEALLSSETGWKVACIRPPQGHENPGLVRRLSQRGLTTVLWSADTRDWTLPGTDTIVRRALADLSPGAIVLMHDGGGDRRETLAALPRIIETVQAQGYRLVPICH